MVSITLWQITTGVVVVAIALLVALTYVYARNLRKVRTPFGLGLLVFALFLLAENVVSLLAIQSWGQWPWWDVIAIPMLAIKLAEVAGFSVLLAISWG